MKAKKNLIYFTFSLLILTLMGMATPSYAGGPLFVATDGKPVRWPNKEVKGGALNSQTVDAQGRVVYRVDQGPLGSLSNAEAVRLVDRIFKLYTDIPTATIEFVNGGTIRDPNTGKPVDITGSNAGLVLSGRNPSFQNPIVLDSDGSITGNGGVLGFFTFINFSRGADGNPVDLLEGGVALNGAALSSIGKVPFIGVFTHEFGHFAGPLDHSQIYGRIASGDGSANGAEGFTAQQRYDIFAPFVETVYPFLFSGPRDSGLSTGGFGSSGAFVASLSFDDVVALSSLYPAPGYLPTEPGSQFGGINGRILIKTSEGDIPITALNVVARRISRGQYPPDPSLRVYGNRTPQVDADGVPLPPADRDELDPLFTATSLVSGLLGGEGAFQFVGLPPGDYLISVEAINPRALGGSSIGPKSPQLEFLVPENYNGGKESSDPKIDDPKDFTPVKVTAGAITGGIDIIVNRFGGSLTRMGENEPNNAKKEAQRISTELQVMGSANSTDSAKISISFFGQQNDGLEDLYRIDLKEPASLIVALDGGKIDFDLYLFSKGIRNGTIPFDSAFILTSSANVGGSELFSTRLLSAGTYFIGVSAFEGGGNYKLTVLKQQ